MLPLEAPERIVNLLFQAMEIKAYLKPTCGWSMGVRAIMDKYKLDYTDLDIINNPELYQEMVEKSGQPLSPCVVIDGVMLADVSGEEVENYMLSNGLVQENDTKPFASTNTNCKGQTAAELEDKTVRFL